MVHGVRLHRLRNAGAWGGMRGNATIVLHLDQTDHTNADSHKASRGAGKHTPTLLPAADLAWCATPSCAALARRAARPRPATRRGNHVA